MKSNYGCIYCPWRVFNPVFFCLISGESVLRHLTSECNWSGGNELLLSTECWDILLDWAHSSDGFYSTHRLQLDEFMFRVGKFMTNKLVSLFLMKFLLRKCAPKCLFFLMKISTTTSVNSNENILEMFSPSTFPTQLVACVIASKDFVKKSRK